MCESESVKRCEKSVLYSSKACLLQCLPVKVLIVPSFIITHNTISHVFWKFICNDK